MTNEEIITEVVNKTDLKSLESGKIEDVERFVNTIIANSLIEQGDLEDDID